MNRTLAYFILFSVPWLPLVAQEVKPQPPETEQLAALRLSWLIAKERDAKPIIEKFRTALVGLRDQLTRDGKLEGAVMVRDYIEALAKSKKVAAPALDADAKKKGVPKDLIRLRGIFEHTMTSMIQQNDAKYRKALLSLKRGFEKAGNLDAALAVKAELDGLDSGKAQQLPAASETYATISSVKGGSSWKELKVGVDCVSNRPGRKWVSIPDELKGMSFSTYAARGTRDVTIEVKEEGIVLVASMGKNLEKLGWEPTELVLVNNAKEKYRVWKTVSMKDIVLKKPSDVHGYIVLRKDQ